MKELNSKIHLTVNLIKLYEYGNVQFGYIKSESETFPMIFS